MTKQTITPPGNAGQQPQEQTEMTMTKLFKNYDQLRELGFQQDEHGQWLAPNCRVNVYQMDDVFQVFVTLRTGRAIAFVARTADTLLDPGADSKAQKQLV